MVLQTLWTHKLKALASAPKAASARCWTRRGPLPEAAVKAFRFILELRELRVILRECDYEISETLFTEGRAAGLDVGIARIPLVSETELWPAPMVALKGYSLNATAAPG